MTTKLEPASVVRFRNAILEFTELLKTNEITVVVDLRSRPYSRRHPQFSKSELKLHLTDAGFEYLWLGDKLGGMEPGIEALLTSNEGRQGLDQLLQLANAALNCAIMCAEGDWKSCHRRIVSRELVHRGVRVIHIAPDGSQRDHPQLLF